ncbi:unnamed protein product [Parajaminaea phylloscopi]
MSDTEERLGGASSTGDDEVSLPRATVQKLIQELLPGDMSVAKEVKDLVIESCTEFIRLVSSEANDICEKSGKRTIGSDHCVQALKDLGFESYLKNIEEVLEDHKAEQKLREKKNSKMARAGLTDEELQKQQEALFAASRARFEAQN